MARYQACDLVHRLVSRSLCAIKICADSGEASHFIDLGSERTQVAQRKQSKNAVRKRLMNKFCQALIRGNLSVRRADFGSACNCNEDYSGSEQQDYSSIMLDHFMSNLSVQGSS